MRESDCLAENELEESKDYFENSKAADAMSSISNIIYTHTNIRDLKVESLEHYDILNWDSVNKSNISTIIIDLQIITLSTEKIKLLWVKALNKDIEITKKQLNLLNKKDDSSSGSLEYDVFLDDVIYGPESRNKRDKLTHDQVIYLKCILSDNNININRISVAYNISVAVFNKIKRDKFTKNLKTRQRKIVKAYGSSKMKLQKEINNFIFTIDHPCTIKEITSY